MNEEQRQIVEISIDRVRRSPSNIRGQHIGDTTELQATMRRRIREGKHPLIYPLLVRRDPDDPDSFMVMEGNRRHTALVAINYPTADCIIEEGATDSDERRISLISDVRKELPLLVLGQSGRVVAGKALAIYEEVAAGARRFEVAEEFGLTTDDVGAMVRLCEDDIPTDVLARVHKGDMALTVFSRLKRQPVSMMQAIVDTKRGQITRKWVDSFIKSNREMNLIDEPETAAPQPEYETIGVDVGSPDGDESVTAVVSFDEYGKRTVARYFGDEDASAAPILNEIRIKLDALRGIELDETDYFILDQIQDVIGELMENSNE